MIEQAPAQPWTPVTDYSWDARKEIDGPTADRIATTFRPSSILDFGCGPGWLVKLLRERLPIAIVNGYDPHRREWKDIPKKPGGHQLVVCREVLEHIELRRIAMTVAMLCHCASKWVYLTTRFHSNPSHLLDVATSDDLDPTHITMLNQDFLRALFVLHGFRRDRAKEQVMDWQQKGRVLVYERA